MVFSDVYIGRIRNSSKNVIFVGAVTIAEARHSSKISRFRTVSLEPQLHDQNTPSVYIAYSSRNCIEWLRYNNIPQSLRAYRFCYLFYPFWLA
jgi:hypothetical protein